jgi:hypothetical protein
MNILLQDVLLFIYPSNLKQKAILAIPLIRILSKVLISLHKNILNYD